ncbi:MAG: trypsin-like peptidase domain-containing protein, partial [Angelakisella sp.]
MMDNFNNDNNNNDRPENERDQSQQNQTMNQQNQPYPPNYYGGQPSGDQNRRTPDGQYYSGQQQPYQWSYEQMHRQVEEAPKKRHKGLKVFGVIAAAIMLTAVSSFAIYGVYVAATGNTLEHILPQTETPAAPSGSSALPEVVINNLPVDPTETGLTNVDIYKKVSPSVVGIISYVGTDYFGETMQEQGSGIIMSEDGYIITNEHVVINAQSLEVVLADGTTYQAQSIGGDTHTDLAVLKIEATGLPAAEFGNSDQLQIGERVVAIGNPGGMQFASSLTVGYVSALNRSLTSGEVGYSLECIQTDAAINPGNSGGALINSSGQVIGINSAKISATGFEGMGFSIPINDAMPIIKDILQNGKVTGRAMLGITAGEISATTAMQNRLPMGLQIREFAEGSDLPNKGAKI